MIITEWRSIHFDFLTRTNCRNIQTLQMLSFLTLCLLILLSELLGHRIRVEHDDIEQNALYDKELEQNEDTEDEDTIEIKKG